MPRRSDIVPTPTVPEHRGCYNINKRQFEEHYPGYDYSTYVACSKPVVPKITDAEFRRIYRACTDFFESWALLYFQQDRTRRYELFHCVAECYFDRTITIEIDSYDLITIPMLEMLKDMLTEKFPMWRILFNGEDEYSSIVVYPSLVCVGAEIQPNKLDGALSAAVAGVTDIRQERNRWLTSQISLVEKAVQSRGMQQVLPCKIAAFNGFDENTDSFSLWTLHEFGDFELTRASPDGSTQYIFRLEFGMHSDGTILKRWIDPEDILFRIYCWEVQPKMINGTIVIDDQANHTRFTTDVNLKDIIYI